MSQKAAPIYTEHNVTGLTTKLVEDESGTRVVRYHDFTEYIYTCPSTRCSRKYCTLQFLKSYVVDKHEGMDISTVKGEAYTKEGLKDITYLVSSVERLRSAEISRHARFQPAK